jgi:hypothetical protein
MMRWLRGFSSRFTLPLTAALVAACTPAASPTVDPLPAEAFVVVERSVLPGGPRALGDIGDVMMQNEHIRVVIQQPGFSRGFGVYGGSLIDADLRRPNEQGSSLQGVGFDNFGELFPAFFLQAVNVDTVEIVHAGRDGSPARVSARGTAGDFLQLVGFLNRAAIGSHVDTQDNTSEQNVAYETVYELAPGDRHVTIRFRVTNISDARMELPSPEARGLLGILGLNLEGFTIPVGDVSLFGATSRLFIPGAGFDVRFGLERAYARNIDFPAFPGLVGDWVATRSQGVSYGLIAEASDSNFVWRKRDIYEAPGVPVSRSSMLFPFVAGGFIGVFYQEAPPGLDPGETFEVVKYFIVGDGDVGSVHDEILRLRGEPSGSFSAMVLDAVSSAPAVGASLIVYQRTDLGPRPYCQFDVEDHGAALGNLPPGEYEVRVQGPGRPLSPPRAFTIQQGQRTALNLTAPSAGRIVVQAVDVRGHRSPAKISVVGTYDASRSGQLLRSFLFDLAAGEHFMFGDLVPDDPDDPATRRYVEAVAFAGMEPTEVLVRPGTYEVWVSRGPEFDVHRQQVEVFPGDTATVTARLERVVDTTGWIAGDMHLHSIQSIDAAMPLPERVLQLAAEGVEWAVATDHNFITDYAPTIEALGLRDFMLSSVGLEMTTLETGHFNGYPLRYEVGAITRGSFEWSDRPPAEVFADLRARGAYGPEETIVQVNHPRDSILGYFEQFDRNALTTEQNELSFFGRFLAPQGPAFVQEVTDEFGNTFEDTTFSWDFDALEIVNGKLLWQIHHFRVPEELPEGDLPARVPPAGAILVESDGDVAFPGAVDDWYNLLNLGFRFTGVGTSDSHSDDDEAGYFRTMIRASSDDPRQVNERDLARALLARQAVATNGPIIDAWIGEPDTGGIGSEVVAQPDGTVRLHLRVTCAPWMRVDRVNVVRNGAIVWTIAVEEGRDLARNPLVEELSLNLPVDGEGQPADAWFLVQAMGFASMFPIVRPAELPPLVLTDAVASLAAPLGFGTAEFGDLVPPEIFPVTPYALTNPIWVRARADREWAAPGLLPLAELNLADNDSGWQLSPQAKWNLPTGPVPVESARPIWRMPAPTGSPFLLFQRNRHNHYDLRRIFEAFGHDH